MKQVLTFAILFLTLSAFAQQGDNTPQASTTPKGSKWMKDEKNILTIAITNKATKAELLDLKKLLWDTYQIKFDLENMGFSKNGKKLTSLSIRVEMPTGEVGTVGTTFVKSSQVIGFHYDRNPEAYDIFGVWAK